MRRYCPYCGKPNRARPNELHRACPACGQVDWINPAPAVGIAILDGHQILLSKRAHPPKKGQWDLVGGFMERNETPEQALRREVREETTCEITSFELQDATTGAYAGRPTLNFLAIGKIRGAPTAQDDSLELRWWPLNQLPKLAWPHEANFLRQLGNSKRR